VGLHGEESLMVFEYHPNFMFRFKQFMGAKHMTQFTIGNGTVIWFKMLDNQGHYATYVEGKDMCTFRLLKVD
jgi:hypothetical protein